MKLLLLKSLFTVFVIVIAEQSSGAPLIFQPGSEGKDAGIIDKPLFQNTNFSSYDRLWISNTAYFGDGYWEERALIEFDLSTVTSSYVDSAVLQLYMYFFDNQQSELGYTDSSVWVHRVTQSWTETSVTWNNSYDNFSAVDKVKQSDPDPTIPYDYDGWVTWDVTAIVNQWLSGAEQNYGFMLLIDDAESAAPNRKLMVSSDYATATYHPKLILFEATIPEPASIILLVCGIIGLLKKRSSIQST